MTRIITADASKISGANFLKGVLGITPEREAEEAEIRRLFLSNDIDAKAEAMLRSVQLATGRKIDHPLLQREPLSELKSTGTGGWFS